jgi:hypothetical protein
MPKKVEKPKTKRKRIPLKKSKKPMPAKRVKASSTIPILPATDPPPPQPAVTADGVVQCRFELFVRLRTGLISMFKDQQRCWCYRGDKYTDEEPRMLKNLLNLAKNKVDNYFLMELYDNNKPRNDGQRLILKVQDRKIKVNRLNNYADMLQQFPLPEWLKPLLTHDLHKTV